MHPFSLNTVSLNWFTAQFPSFLNSSENPFVCTYSKRLLHCSSAMTIMGNPQNKKIEANCRAAASDGKLAFISKKNLQAL